MKEIVIINGPNLNLLGKREPSIYGTTSFEEYFKVLQRRYTHISLYYFQSNIEGELIDYLHKVGFTDVKIILNAAGYTHTSVALADAVAAIDAEVIEVHISQPAAREKERHTSLISKYCKGSISGLGLFSYDSAINYFIHKENA